MTSKEVGGREEEIQAEKRGAGQRLEDDGEGESDREHGRGERKE